MGRKEDLQEANTQLEQVNTQLAQQTEKINAIDATVTKVGKETDGLKGINEAQLRAIEGLEARIKELLDGQDPELDQLITALRENVSQAQLRTGNINTGLETLAGTATTVDQKVDDSVGETGSGDGGQSPNG